MRLRSFALIAGTAFAALLGVTAPVASAAEPSSDVQPMIIGGQNATSGPWAARLFANGRQTCTSTIIAPQYILTAKHCVASSGTFTFRIGSLDQQSGGTMATGSTVTRHPSADLAIVKLTTSVNATYSPLGTTANVSVGQTVQVYGWGATSQCGSEINCQSRYLKVANVSVTSVSCRDYNGGIAVCARRGDGITAGGDSGGPMFASGRQVGVASTSDRQTTTAYTNITRYRPWIQQIAGV
ncbi:trypsin-like serine protease [Amycolatopsis keratiniphila]|uniref:Trypsin n=1 Tax=Amycolatopsis lurida NRRL 2430 TaxID=1460371 RepID=A0A2P2FN14_AMYLU|nr:MULTISPECIES: trypsin-like serine protease [Amycolatopsis]KFU78123.1 trypsin [Amycolatopsis lurida NRRL 2430]RSN28997.1 trypsin [Amycolatopsis sp. WAC 04169]SEC35113.1 Trypsin [Amycolatopsis lurida]